MSSSLPAFITGVDAVLTSPRNGATFTFRLSGGVVSAISSGDTHETGAGLDSLAQRATLDAAGVLGSNFTLVLYPTAELRDSYYTNNPRDATIGVVCIIVAIALLFRLYDLAVQYHSGELAAVASVASRIVDGVFPETVRNRLFRHAAAASGALPVFGSSSGGGGGGAGGGAIMSRSSGEIATPASGPFAAARLLMLKLAADRPRRSASGASTATPRDSAPGDGGVIADSFEAATVLFADLVSFTQWSSDQQPERVFTVLEAVFSEFDAAARALNVFKVETIGDCYMACAGCPEAMEGHAAAMGDFALALGPALSRACAACGMPPGALSLRVGMHSGSVTAGVLRADRSRFQLFGDTVNTASRMESTGEAGRIQVSAATAELLRPTAARHALQYRGKVEAKGKGMMDTFWLTAALLPSPAGGGGASGGGGAAV